ncbi:MAG: transcriptional regulator [Desulfobulbaceae bacterium DB1]|nr:MAG: transcriptional regulator [Desulfobulbaceae bacterium DB1]
MPLYEYEHSDQSCSLGVRFEISQSLSSPKLTQCPQCGHPVKRLISLCAISTPKTNSDLKNLGFTKLVRRDNGVYENVTATGRESKIWDAGKPETMPDLRSKIRD